MASGWVVPVAQAFFGMDREGYTPLGGREALRDSKVGDDAPKSAKMPYLAWFPRHFQAYAIYE